jgi:hypothetical protein
MTTDQAPIERAAEVIGAVVMRRPEQAAWLSQDILRRQARAAFESIDAEALALTLFEAAWRFEGVDPPLWDDLDEYGAAGLRAMADAVKAWLLGGAS